MANVLEVAKIMISKSFHNTTNLSGDDLAQSEAQAQNQDKRILEFFNSHQDELFTPCEVWQKVFKRDVPLTSVRRAITNLTKANHLTKTTQSKIGIYGRMNLCWIKESQDKINSL